MNKKVKNWKGISYYFDKKRNYGRAYIYLPNGRRKDFYGKTEIEARNKAEEFRKNNYNNVNLKRMEKLERIETKLDSLEVIEEPIILTTTDVMRILGINRATANKLFKEDGFPKISFIKSNKIEQKAFTEWLRGKTQ